MIVMVPSVGCAGSRSLGHGRAAQQAGYGDRYGSSTGDQLLYESVHDSPFRNEPDIHKHLSTSAIGRVVGGAL